MLEGGLNPSYVLDKMKIYELQPLLKNIHKKNRDAWEQARFISYIIAQVNSSKKLKIKDILNFEWDEEEAAENTSISNSDIERLRNKAKQFLNNKK